MSYNKQEEEDRIRKAVQQNGSVGPIAQNAASKAISAAKPTNQTVKLTSTPAYAVGQAGTGVTSGQGAVTGGYSTQQTGYQSGYQKQLDDTMNKILNREQFSYDLNGDGLWKQYQDQYIQKGKMAMMDTMGQAAALTGGYGSSYGQTVGQQAYQGYLQELNQMIPELYQLALQKYQMEGDQLSEQYGLLADQDDRAYNRYVDDRDYQYQVGRDQVADDQWQQQFDYQQNRDAVSDARYDQEWEYQKGRDQISDQRYDQEWKYQQDRDAIEDSRYDQEWEYQQGRDQVSDDQWQAEFDEDKRRYDQEYEDSKGRGSGSGSGTSSGGSGKYADMSDSQLRNEIIRAGSLSEAEKVAGEAIADGWDEDYVASMVAMYYDDDKASTAGAATPSKGGSANSKFNYSV